MSGGGGRRPPCSDLGVLQLCVVGPPWESQQAGGGAGRVQGCDLERSGGDLLPFLLTGRCFLLRPSCTAQSLFSLLKQGSEAYCFPDALAKTEPDEQETLS